MEDRKRSTVSEVEPTQNRRIGEAHLQDWKAGSNVLNWQRIVEPAKHKCRVSKSDVLNWRRIAEPVKHSYRFTKSNVLNWQRIVEPAKHNAGSNVLNWQRIAEPAKHSCRIWWTELTKNRRTSEVHKQAIRTELTKNRRISKVRRNRVQSVNGKGIKGRFIRGNRKPGSTNRAAERKGNRNEEVTSWQIMGCVVREVGRSPLFLCLFVFMSFSLPIY